MRCSLRLALSVCLTLASAAASADNENDYERGFRNGYERGYEAGREAAKREAFRDGRSGYSGGHRLPSGIVVMNASYGDGERRCDLTAWALQQFNQRTSASVVVNNKLCGDPSPGQRKSLSIEYLCRGEARTASAYEHRTLRINCY